MVNQKKSLLYIKSDLKEAKSFMSKSLSASDVFFEKLYTPVYVERQLEKFRGRHHNHWKAHLDLAAKLASEHAPPPPARMLDLGCSIGTFALEFASRGYETIGLDLDAKSLDIARELANELGCSPDWVHADATNFILDQPVDFVVCFDLFEHLTDDQLTKMLDCVKQCLCKGGCILFHTFPTEYDHIFYRNNLFCLPLLPFRKANTLMFNRVVEIYSWFIDCFFLIRRGRTWKRIISKSIHPNPLSRERLVKFLESAGFMVDFIETSIDTLNPLRVNQGRIAKKFFSHQRITHRSIWGVAFKP